MGNVTTSLTDRAQSIFTDLGYAVSQDGEGLRAERKWRVVQVTPMDEPETPPGSGDLRCFVTWSDRIDGLERELERVDPDYDWAIIGVEENEEYVVAGPPRST
jgi:hypothetical protein